MDRGYTYQRAPPLPEWRFDTANPWMHTNVDMTGHYYIKTCNSTVEQNDVKARKSAVEEKVYLVIFVCMSTGSGHIEVVHDATSKSFAEAMSRFINRCGAPRFFTVTKGAISRDIAKSLRNFLNPKIFKIFVKTKVSNGFGPQ